MIHSTFFSGSLSARWSGAAVGKTARVSLKLQVGGSYTVPKGRNLFWPYRQTVDCLHETAKESGLALRGGPVFIRGLGRRIIRRAIV